MKYGHIFWDWNGTLLDDLDSGIRSINISLEKRGLPLVTRESYPKLFGFPVIDYYRRVGFNFDTDPYEVLAGEFIDSYNRLSINDGLQKQARSVLTRLNRLGVKQYILSASESEMLFDGLNRCGIAELFTEIIGCSDIYATGKTQRAKEWLEKNALTGRALMIGDTLHDFEVARELGFDCILFSGGHYTADRLCHAGVPVFDSLEKIFNYLTGGNKKTSSRDSEAYMAFYNDVKLGRKTQDW